MLNGFIIAMRKCKNGYGNLYFNDKTNQYEIHACWYIYGDLKMEYGLSSGIRKKELRTDIFGKKYWAILEYRQWTTCRHIYSIEQEADQMEIPTYHDEWRYVGKKPFINGKAMGTNFTLMESPVVKKTWWRVILWGGDSPFAPWNKKTIDSIL